MIARGDGDPIHEGNPMTKLPTLDFKGMMVAVNPAYILRIEEREGKDGLPRCVMYFADKSMLTWDGHLATLVPLLL
jgi:hypothetical protein